MILLLQRLSCILLWHALFVFHVRRYSTSACAIAHGIVVHLCIALLCAVVVFQALMRVWCVAVRLCPFGLLNFSTVTQIKHAQERNSAKHNNDGKIKRNKQTQAYSHAAALPYTPAPRNNAFAARDDTTRVDKFVK